MLGPEPEAEPTGDDMTEHTGPTDAASAPGPGDDGAAADRRADDGGGARIPGLDPPETTVHEALGDLPGAREVFARFGIDACCGGELPLAVAAEHHGVELDRLLDALARADGGE